MTYPALRLPVVPDAKRYKSTRWPTAGAGRTVASRSKASTTALAWAIGCWFALLLVFNDVGQLFNLRIGINLRPDRLFLPLLILVWMVHPGRNRGHVCTHPAEWSLLLLLLWSVLSLFVAGTIYHPHNRHVSTLVSWLGLPLATLWCVRRARFTPQDISVVFRVLVGLGVYVAITAVFEHYEMWSAVFPRYIADPSIGIHWGRPRGPFGNSAVLGSVLSAIYVIALFHLNFVRAPRWSRAAILGLIAVAIYFTYTRSGWLAFVVTLVSLAVLDTRMRRHSAAALIVVLVVFLSGAFSKFSLETGTLFGKRQSTVEDRANIMRASLEMFREKPFVGFGYGTFQSSNYRYFDSQGRRSAAEGNHNAFSGLLVELGLIGFVPYIATWWVLLTHSWRLARRPRLHTPFLNQLGAVTFSALIAYLVGVQFFDPRFFAFMNCLVFFLAGLMCAAEDQEIGSIRTKRTS